MCLNVIKNIETESTPKLLQKKKRLEERRKRQPLTHKRHLVLHQAKPKAGLASWLYSLGHALVLAALLMFPIYSEIFIIYFKASIFLDIRRSS